MSAYRTLMVICVLGTFLTACGPGTTLDVSNDSSSAIVVTVDGVDTDVAAGETRNVDLDVPVLNKKADVDLVILGDYVYTSQELTVTVGEGNPMVVEDNAGAMEVSNTGTSTISSVYITRTSGMDDSWVFGLGDWGDDLGSISAGDTMFVPGVSTGSDWAIKWDSTVRLNNYTVGVGQITSIGID